MMKKALLALLTISLMSNAVFAASLKFTISAPQIPDMDAHTYTANIHCGFGGFFKLAFNRNLSSTSTMNIHHFPTWFPGYDHVTCKVMMIKDGSHVDGWDKHIGRAGVLPGKNNYTIKFEENKAVLERIM